MRFADDAALVIPDFEKVADDILMAFGEYAIMSGLKLNMAKTVLVPLFPCRLDVFLQKTIHEAHPNWSNVSVAHDGAYLGFIIGPTGYKRQWKKAIS
eukprot:5276488-Heterocapsa_arctica.AAC.1